MLAEKIGDTSEIKNLFLYLLYKLTFSVCMKLKSDHNEKHVCLNIYNVM